MTRLAAPTIDEWVEYFVATRDSDVRVSIAAHAWVNERMWLPPEVLLDMASTIVPDESQPLVARRMASFAAVRALRPTSARHLSEIRDGWAAVPGLAARVKAWLYQGVLCADDVLRGQAALAFALVFGIEGEAWSESLSQIHEKLTEWGGSPVQAAGLLLVFKEILNLGNVADLKGPALIDGYAGLWADALSTVGSEADVHPLLRVTAAECVRDALEALPELCMYDDSAPNVEQVGVVLQSLPASLRQPDVKLFLCCHRIMFNILRSYYTTAPAFIHTIWEYTMAGLELDRPEQTEFRDAAIFFWKEVAVFEKDIKPSHGIVVTAGEALLPKFWDIMCEVPAENTDIQDPSENSPSVYATMAVAAFYQAAPGIIFTNFISPTFTDAVETAHDWPVQHAALLLLFCLSAEDGDPLTFKFIQANLGHLIEFCQRDDVPRIRETALYVLAMVLKSYKALFLDAAPQFSSETLIPAILSLLHIETNIHPVILSRYALIVFHLGQIWAEEHPCWSPLPPFFRHFVEIMKTIMSRPIENEYDILIYQNACEALNALIVNGSWKEGNLLRQLFQETLRELEESGRAIEADNVRYAVQARLCSNLTSLTVAIGKDMANDELHQAVGCVFHILEQRNPVIYEEAVMSLASLYLKLYDEFLPDELDQMLSIVRDGLNSGSPGVINSASILLADLYHWSGKQFVEQFPEFLELEVGLLCSHDEMRQIHPFLIKAIAEMFEGVGDGRVLAEYETQLFDLMKMVRAVSIDPKSHSDMQYADYLFEYLTSLYRVFAKLFYPETNGVPNFNEVIKKEKGYLLEFAELANVIWRLEKLNGFVLFQFAEAARQFASKCSRRNNVVLNRRSVHKVLDIAQNDKQKLELQRKAREVQLVLLNR
jgi:hypothetical protein